MSANQDGTYLGATNVIVKVTLLDSAGLGKTGLAFGTSGLTCYATINGAASSVRTLATMSIGTWASLGFVEIDATNMPGNYFFSVPVADYGAIGRITYVFNGAGVVSGNFDLDVFAFNVRAAPPSVFPANVTQFDGVATTSLTELSNGTLPPATAYSFLAAFQYIFARVRNKKTSTVTQIKTYKADGATVLSTQTISDDGTTFTDGAAS